MEMLKSRCELDRDSSVRIAAVQAAAASKGQHRSKRPSRLRCRTRCAQNGRGLDGSWSATGPRSQPLRAHRDTGKRRKRGCWTGNPDRGLPGRSGSEQPKCIEVFRPIPLGTRCGLEGRGPQKLAHASNTLTPALRRRTGFGAGRTLPPFCLFSSVGSLRTFSGIFPLSSVRHSAQPLFHALASLPVPPICSELGVARTLAGPT
jgi:hypothetical protein